MEHEKSCGCIIIDGQKVLLIKTEDDQGNIYWGFPKGHQEPGETDFETALRETKEEVGLDVTITHQTPIKTSHLVKGGTANKDILLFLAQCANQKPAKHPTTIRENQKPAAPSPASHQNQKSNPAPATSKPLVQIQEDEVLSAEWVAFDRADELLAGGFQYYLDAWREARQRLEHHPR